VLSRFIKQKPLKIFFSWTTGRNALYSVWIIIGERRFKYVQRKSLGSCMAPPQGLKFHIVIYWEMLKISSSQELVHQMGQYLTWIIPRTRTFTFVQIKSLGSQMATS